MALMEFLPCALLGLEGGHRQRAALLERGCLFARRQMWDEAPEDLAAAVDLAAVAPLHALERATAGRYLLAKSGGFPLARDTDLARRIARVCDGSAFGTDVLRALAQPLIWRLREAVALGRPRETFAYLAAVRRMCWPGGFAGAPGRSARRRMVRA